MGKRNPRGKSLGFWRSIRDLNSGGAVNALSHFECDLFDLLSNAPYEIVRHRPRASFGRMRDFGARTANIRRGTRPRKARRSGIHRGQTGQWVTPFRVLHHRPLGQLSIFYFLKHRLARPSDKCKILMQDMRENFRHAPRFLPRVKPNPADESARKPQTFECDLFDLLSNAPYWRQRRGAADVPNYYSKFRLFRQMFFARAGRGPARRRGAGNKGQRRAARAFSRSAART